MFEVKWFLFKSEKEMNADKILPIDLYHAVSIANLTLESALKVIHVEAGQDHELLPLEPGTLAVICRGGKFECKALGKEISIVAGQVFLASVEDVSEISRFSETGFEGIVIYAGSDLLINRQRLMFRTITPDELKESGLYIQLMQSQIERMSDVRVKVVESLLRALIFFLQRIAVFFQDQKFLFALKKPLLKIRCLAARAGQFFLQGCIFGFLGFALAVQLFQLGAQIIVFTL